MPRYLFVKLSSMGDVVHNFPAVTDLARAHPGAEVHWVTESAYAGLVGLHPAVKRVWTVNLRHLKGSLSAREQWRELLSARRKLQQETFDAIIDTQGLIKSAWVAGWANGPRYGMDRASAREPLAALRYTQKLAAPKQLHAVERNRCVLNGLANITEPAQYGIKAPAARPAWLTPPRYAVLLTATSRADKQWPEADWVALGEQLRHYGLVSCLLAGSADERAVAEHIAARIVGAQVAPALSLVDAAAVLGHAALVVGVDTGLAHLANALDTPTIGIYTATDPARTGLYAGRYQANVGGKDTIPSVDMVLAAANPWIR